MLSCPIRVAAKLLIAAFVLAAAQAANWPSYRGPSATGVAEGDAPVKWNADPTAGPIQGVRWKTPIPGLSHSSPILWGERLYVATAVAKSGKAPLKIGLYGAGDSADDNGEQSWMIFCLDRKNGKIIWSATAHSGVPRARRHTKATHANTTLATDGKRIVAFFGSEGLFAFSMDGKPLWKKDLGTLDMAPFDDRSLSWGFASSPVLFEDTVIVQCDVKKDGFTASFSAVDGKELWRTPRGQVSVGSWGTPGVFRTGNRTQVVLNGYPYIAGYDWKTGKELWRLKSEGDVPVPVPFLAGDFIYVANAHGGKAPLYAIRTDASGDISLTPGSPSSSGVAWSEERNGSYLQTPVVHKGIAYASTSNGVWKAYDAKTGRKLYEQRLGGGTTGFTSSPVAAGNYVYVTSEEGETYVIEAGSSLKVAATNAIGEIVLSTPAIADGALYFRTRDHIIAIGK
jgi:outer membrane protein assembly factor BamB